MFEFERTYPSRAASNYPSRIQLTIANCACRRGLYPPGAHRLLESSLSESLLFRGDSASVSLRPWYQSRTTAARVVPPAAESRVGRRRGAAARAALQRLGRPPGSSGADKRSEWRAIVCVRFPIFRFTIALICYAPHERKSGRHRKH